MLTRALRDYHASETDLPPGDNGLHNGDAQGFTHRQLAAMLTMLRVQPATFPERRAAMAERLRNDILRHAVDLESARLERVLSAVRQVPREVFVPQTAQDSAYLPAALKIGHGQTISAPLVMAVMTMAAEIGADGHVLDIGTGSGYQAAILSALARSVVSVEILEPLAGQARDRLRDLGYGNVDVVTGDGSLGMRACAPYDAIIVAAGAATIPQTLLDQLKPGGRLVMPIGASAAEEQLVVAHKGADSGVSVYVLGPARFVPLTGVGERPDLPASCLDARRLAGPR
jgi:protein-L-isoaspartate(D-aspartate) O-methyltransferase